VAFQVIFQRVLVLVIACDIHSFAEFSRGMTRPLARDGILRPTPLCNLIEPICFRGRWLPMCHSIHLIFL
jgi:hypothetical protein